jgi:CBS domain containing-hemolysin-like protein
MRIMAMADDSSSSALRFFQKWKGRIMGEPEASLRDQIEDVIDEAEEDGDTPEAGDLSEVERDMLRNLLHFGERTVGDVAVPRADIIAVSESVSFPDLVKALAEAGHSRLPVYRDDLDTITGMVLMKDVFAMLASEAKPSTDEVFTLRQPLFVPPSMGAVELLGRMRAEQIHLAIVTDEYGGTDGLVTLEDLVEEIFDEIADEHDDAPVDLLIRQEDGSWSADARAPLYDVADEIDPRLAETDVDIDTLGGVAFWLAGQVPAAGARLMHPSGWEIEVTEADERRVRAMRLHPPAPRQEEAERDGTE